MSDLISRQAAIDAVSRGCQEFRGIFAECEKNLNELQPVQPEITLESAIDYLHSIGWMQSHDKQMYEDGQRHAQQEIIRCWECKYYHHEDYELPYCDRRFGFYAVDLDDFCSKAERREDGQTD